MARILIYYPSNKRSNVIETTLFKLRDRGHEVCFLSISPKGDIHAALDSGGIPAFGSDGEGYLSRIKKLMGFCKKHRIQYVFSHLHQTNLPSVIAQFFMRSKVIVFRHHFHYVQDSGMENELNRMEGFFDRIISKLAKKIVVPSESVADAMIRYESVSPRKISVIPYIYDFSQYAKPEHDQVAYIRSQYPCKLLLIMVSRMIKLKRHMEVLPVVKELVDAGYDLQLLLLDEGVELPALQTWVHENRMQDRIHFLGYQRGFINYMAASDMLLQPSLTDASNNVAKEMALLGKLVAVSDHVGDYNDYVVDGENGFLLPIRDPHDALVRAIKKAYDHPESCASYGLKLRKAVVEQFGVENSDTIMAEYEHLLA